RPGPLPRARPPPRDLRERAAGRDRRLAGEPPRRARRRVPDARRRAGPEPARAQARGAPRGLRARRVRAAPRRGVRARAHRGARRRDARPLPRAPPRVTAHVRRFGEVFGLSGLALAEPLYDLLGKNPEFFSVRGASPGEIVAFAVALALVPPIAFFSLELLAGLAGRRAAVAVHLVLVGGLVAVIALEALRRVGGPTAVPIVLAALVGAAAAAGYARLRALRTVAGVLAAAPVVFLALFLLESQSSKLVLSAEAKTHVEAAKATTPVVLLVLDELPTNSLLDARRRIDPVRFPNFAAVARVTTWFPNATTVSEGTTGAVPAILSGLYPKPGQQPRLADHPDNLFTLLGGRYRQVAFERETRLCPAGLCQEDTHA